MTILCGECGKANCECGKMQTGHPAAWATGPKLDAIATKVGIARNSTGQWIEPDDTLRARVQLSLIKCRPWISGIPGGRLLDRMAIRDGINRGPSESDAELLARWLLSTMRVQREDGKQFELAG